MHNDQELEIWQEGRNQIRDIDLTFAELKFRKKELQGGFSNEEFS